MAPSLAFGPSFGAVVGRTVMPLTTSPGRGFFLGPGLPRGFGTPSMVICEALRFMPGFGPGIPFRLTGLGGGASKLLFVAADGMGVPLESEPFAEGEGSATGLFVGGLEPVDDEVDLVCDEFVAGRSEGNFERRSAESRRVTINDLVLAAFEEAFEPVAEVADDMVVVVDAIAVQELRFEAGRCGVENKDGPTVAQMRRGAASAPPFDCEGFVGAKLLLYRAGKGWVFY